MSPLPTTPSRPLKPAAISDKTRPIRPSRRKRGILAVTSLGLAGLLAGLLTGCSGNLSKPAADPSSSAASPTGTATYVAATGNWKFTTTSARLSTLAGSLAVSGTAVTGTLHPVAGSCLGPTVSTAAFPVSGSISSQGRISLTSQDFLGGTLSITGPLASDGQSIESPSITVTGGPCATPVAAPQGIAASPRDNPSSTGQQFQPITGTYTGTLSSSAGGSLAVTTHLSQPTTPDSNGVYHLTGTATFADTSCINAPVVTDSTVSGDSLTATYTDSATGNTVSGAGTLSADAQTLTITSWTLSGSCGTDTGTGLLTRSGS